MELTGFLGFVAVSYRPGGEQCYRALLLSAPDCHHVSGTVASQRGERLCILTAVGWESGVGYPGGLVGVVGYLPNATHNHSAEDGRRPELIRTPCCML